MWQNWLLCSHYVGRKEPVWGAVLGLFLDHFRCFRGPYVQAHGALFYSREQHQMVWGMCQAGEESGTSWGGGEHSFPPLAAAPAVSEADLRMAVLWVSTAAMAGARAEEDGVRLAYQ